MNQYVSWLHEVAQVVYLVGNYEQTSQLKKFLDPGDPKHRIFFRCFEEFPSETFKKVKLKGPHQGIIRSHWLKKTLEMYPEMVVFLFNLGDQTSVEKVEIVLKEILRKINLFTIDTLKQNGKEDVFVRIVVTLTKTQMNSAPVFEKVNYYLKSYEKDSFVICLDNLGKDIARYRFTWLNFLEKNYERKLKKIQRKLEESISNDRRICFAFKQAILYQILGREEKQRYGELYSNIKAKFSGLTSKQFTFLKYLEIRELRVLGDIVVLRSIKGKIITNTKEIPTFIQDHINFFKMRNLDPNSSHFYYYFQELSWRAAFLEKVLQVLGATDIIENIPHSTVAEWLNGLLSYLYRLSTVSPSLLEGLGGQILKLTQDNYLGRYDYDDVTDADIVMTEITELLGQRKDLMVKGAQLVARYKNSGLFKQNEINFLNIYLIRFHLAQGKFSAIADIFNKILRLEVSRSNYFLINQLIRPIEEDIDKIDPKTRTYLYGVISLLCDYFENEVQLDKFLELFLEASKPEQQQLIDIAPSKQTSTGSEDMKIFKLRKNSMIFAVKVLIDQQIILGSDRYKLKLKIFLGSLVREKVKSGDNFIIIKFNQQEMVHKLKLDIGDEEGKWFERDVEIEPLQFIHKDSVFHIGQIRLAMSQQNLVWFIERSQLSFERFDSTMFHSKIRQPEIEVSSLKKVYYLNETFSFSIKVKEVEDCEVSAKLSVIEEDEFKTQFYLNGDDQKDLTNSSNFEDLSTGNSNDNTCWIKCNKLGYKSIKLAFNIEVKKTIPVCWRDKPLNIRSTYNNTVREIKFNVLHPFLITKSFKEAITGSHNEGKVSIGQKMMLAFNVKANDHIFISEIGHHNNPRKIRYLKNFKNGNLQLAPSDSVKLNMLFMLDEDSTQDNGIFLTALFVKWRRQGSPFDNTTLDENTIIRTIPGTAEVTFRQNTEFQQKKKGVFVVKVRNGRSDSGKVRVSMDSSQELLRIGQKVKWGVLNAFQTQQFEFSVICMKSGIFQLPPIKVSLNNADVKVNTSKFLVQCQ